jgi:hypothetical protein
MFDEAEGNDVAAVAGVLHRSEGIFDIVFSNHFVVSWARFAIAR